MDAVLSAAQGPGSWRFERDPGSGPQVQIKVLQGQATSVTPAGAVFRLRGEPGKRIAFVIVPRR